jgi:5-(carboxyamino)imidazole ribonucleotide mutase
VSEPLAGAGAPQVGIVLGSDSDWPVMEDALRTLDRFGVAAEVRVLSAHRRPDATADYARTAHQRGIRVIIAGAGAAAHLPGVLASHTHLPVVGVPVLTQGLGGLDSLLSIVQMPAGVPVATVGINRAGNAALLALEMLALFDGGLADRLRSARRELSARGEQADRALQEKLRPESR